MAARPSHGPAMADPRSSAANQALAEAAEQAAEDPRDYAPEGGRFMVSGQLVDSEGCLVGGDGDVPVATATTVTGTEPPPDPEAPTEPTEPGL